MSSPSIIPRADRLDRDTYLVLEQFRSGAAWRETEEGEPFDVIVGDILTGQYERPLRVVAFNPIEGWARDATEDVARELERRIGAEGRAIGEALDEFLETHLGRRIGIQLSLL